MKRFIFIYVVFIPGCVLSQRPSELRADVIATEYSSSKNAKDLALCASDEWEKKIITGMKIQMKETSKGYSVWIEQSIGSPLISLLSLKENAMLLADIENTPTGSIARYRISFSDNEKYWAANLEKCLNAPSVRSSEQFNSNGSISQKLQELNELKNSGLITEDEFQNKKKSLLEKL